MPNAVQWGASLCGGWVLAASLLLDEYGVFTKYCPATLVRRQLWMSEKFKARHGDLCEYLRQTLSVPWSLRPQNRAAAATCGHGRCELPAILRLTPKSLAASDFFAAGEAKNPAISAAEWLRARLRPPWSLRFCDAIFVPLRSNSRGAGVQVADCV